jgi:hypothetical protein
MHPDGRRALAASFNPEMTQSPERRICHGLRCQSFLGTQNEPDQILAPLRRQSGAGDEIAPQRGAAVALLALSGVRARHDATGVTENREALGSADMPQALSKKKSRPG